ncbi:MAG: HypC/HybG/HupF family hydrogenase formation chaperone [Conexibacteraceae bacterium]|nr:HypC/HybG/HupF family hydrogenase formation chaperone [Conexibacteraceae bacterium]
MSGPERASESDPVATCGSEHCITCGDDGEPMTVQRVDDATQLALCDDADGARHTVEVALVAPVSRGDTLLVHAGTALVQLTREPTA